MKFLKFLVVVLTIFSCSVFTFGYLNETEVLDTIVKYYERKPSTLVTNKYVKDDDISFVKLTDDFKADSKEELYNIYYTIIASGMDEFTFYCSVDYVNCINEVIKINDNADSLSQMNNFVHVYNSFKSIKTTYTTRGKVTLSINRVYNEFDIAVIEETLDLLEDDIFLNTYSEYDKIKAIHDFVINNTKYNVEDENKPGTYSSNALGVLIKGLATCNGYTDTVALLLDRINVKNVRISNDDHIWNLVYTDGKWLHLDSTWDDPINNLNQDILSHDYFLKTTKEFDNMGTYKPENRHDFDREIYKFAL